MNHTALGKRIRQYRTNQGMTQSQLAEKLNVSYQQVQKYEKGDSQINISRLIEIAEALGAEPLTLVPEIISSSNVSEPGKRYKTHSENRMQVTAREKQLIESYRKIKSAVLKNDVFKLIKSIAVLRTK